MARLSRTSAFDDRSRMLDRFGTVLLLSAVSVVGLALVDITGPVARLARELGALTSAVVVGATLLVALRASGLSRRRQRVLDVLVSLTVLGYGLTVLLDVAGGSGDEAYGVSSVIAVLSVAAPVVVVGRLMRHRTVTTGTMYGAISAYLLIAVAYFFVFLSVGHYQGAFFVQDATEVQPSSSYMYFSLTSITTVGYGDLTATTHLGRLLANSEAVVGQVYLVTFVAMIVGLRAAEWGNRRGGRSVPLTDAPEATEQPPGRRGPGHGNDEGPPPR